ncbi:MAG TPA: DUF2117 domain-containing protein, partial [Methanoregulaceae archaeon]|nr:DUF2117 domain-containing protein [Methanoregulaceae archaeon]
MASRSDPCILVLHGPEVFDAGDVHYLIERLHPERVIVAGVMARTAAEESGIDCEFISVPPSLVLKDISGCAILANHGKIPESGRIFGEIVASRLFPRGLIHLECSDKTLYVWNQAVDNL